MTTLRRYWLPILMMLAGATMLGIYWLQTRPYAPTVAQATPTLTPEPIIPTRTPQPSADATPLPETLPQATDLATPAAVRATIIPSADLSYRGRFGVSGGLVEAERAFNAGLPFGALLNWDLALEPPPLDAAFWQMVRVGPDGIRNITWEGLDEVVANNPGAVWMVGNEPDVPWQDGVTAETYAEIYHDVYTFIKERDARASIAIGGVSQSTPLRRAYLDRILDHYQETYGTPMPVDIWNVHAFTLREEADSWGVGIPPGMDVTRGELYEIDDHADLTIWKQNLIDFRAWMAERGYANRPLAVSEYGILLPEDYGFPPELVRTYMQETVAFMQTAANETGYAQDDGRLVQWWFWYSVFDPAFYPTGNLFDPESGQLTPLGEAYQELIAGP